MKTAKRPKHWRIKLILFLRCSIGVTHHRNSYNNHLCRFYLAGAPERSCPWRKHSSILPRPAASRMHCSHRRINRRHTTTDTLKRSRHSRWVRLSASSRTTAASGAKAQLSRRFLSGHTTFSWKTDQHGDEHQSTYVTPPSRLLSYGRTKTMKPAHPWQTTCPLTLWLYDMATYP